MQGPETHIKTLQVRDKYLLSSMFLVPLLLAAAVSYGGLQETDQQLLDFISTCISPGLTRVMEALTFLGNHQFLIPANLLLITLLLIRKEKGMALTVLIVALSSLFLKLGLKELFRRPRPDNPLVEGITNYSFPSGHALMSVAFYGLLIWMGGRYIREPRTRFFFTLLMLLLIGLIGFSRLYLRVHYPSDVIAGYCLGTAWLWLCLLLTRRLRPL